jgi:hypothetical protein
MYDLRRDPAVGRLAAEFLVHLRASRRQAPPSAPAAPSVWQKVPGILDLARKITINVVVIVIGCVLIAVTIKAAIQPQFVFESIRLPNELANSGYGSNVLADRVLDRVHAINQQASKNLTSFITPRTETVTERMFIGTTPQYAALSAIQVPSSSLNLQSVVLLLRDLFKPDDIRVTGDLTVVTNKKPDDRLAAAAVPGGKAQELVPPLPSTTYILQLRYVRGPIRQARTITAADFDQLTARAAEALLDLSDPHILASYQYAKRAWSSVDEILDRVLGVGLSASDGKWALRLRGQRLLDLNRSSEAIRYFKQVALLDSDASGYKSSTRPRTGNARSPTPTGAMVCKRAATTRAPSSNTGERLKSIRSTRSLSTIGATPWRRRGTTKAQSASTSRQRRLSPTTRPSSTAGEPSCARWATAMAPWRNTSTPWN